jgi:hypothetical protein
MCVRQELSTNQIPVRNFSSLGYFRCGYCGVTCDGFTFFIESEFPGDFIFDFQDFEFLSFFGFFNFVIVLMNLIGFFNKYL